MSTYKALNGTTLDVAEQPMEGRQYKKDIPLGDICTWHQILCVVYAIVGIIIIALDSAGSTNTQSFHRYWGGPEGGLIRMAGRGLDSPTEGLDTLLRPTDLATAVDYWDTGLVDVRWRVSVSAAFLCWIAAFGYLVDVIAISQSIAQSSPVYAKWMSRGYNPIRWITFGVTGAWALCTLIGPMVGIANTHLLGHMAAIFMTSAVLGYYSELRNNLVTLKNRTTTPPGQGRMQRILYFAGNPSWMPFAFAGLLAILPLATIAIYYAYAVAHLHITPMVHVILWIQVALFGAYAGLHPLSWINPGYSYYKIQFMMDIVVAAAVLSLAFMASFGSIAPTDYITAPTSIQLFA